MDNLLNDVLVGVPDEVANLQLPDPDLRDYYRDEQDRVIWIRGPIEAGTLDIVETIMRYNKEDKGKPVEDRKRILIMIDSPGGVVDVEQSIIGAIKTSITPVYTCVYCTAYSAAADVLACGHKRYALPFTNIMFHAGSGSYQGTQSQIDSAKKFFDKVAKRIDDEVRSHVNFDKKTIRKLKTEDIYFTEIEALEMGVIDQVVENLDELM